MPHWTLRVLTCALLACGLLITGCDGGTPAPTTGAPSPEVPQPTDPVTPSTDTGGGTGAPSPPAAGTPR